LQYEKPQARKTQCNKQEGLENLLANKGKQKEEDTPPARDDYAHLCDRWREEYTDILGGTQDRLPLWREVNHEINLIDKDKRYMYHLPQCPNSLRDEFHEKVNQYVKAGWWEPKPVNQAAPMLCIHKKDKHLRTIVDTTTE
jgi:hypothetical protein